MNLCPYNAQGPFSALGEETLPIVGIQSEDDFALCASYRRRHQRKPDLSRTRGARTILRLRNTGHPHHRDERGK